MQNIIFWFFNKYGFYFYIEKFKIINNKILLQFYYYKTYLYYRKYYKKKIFKARGATTLFYRNPLLHKASQFKSSNAFLILNSKNFKLPKRRIIKPNLKKGKLGYVRKLKIFLKKLNLFYPIQMSGLVRTVENKKMISSSFYKFSYKLWNYFSNYCLLGNNYFMARKTRRNLAKFLLMASPTMPSPAMQNHLYSYVYFKVAKLILPQNKFFRMYLLRDILALKKKKKENFAIFLEASVTKPLVSAEANISHVIQPEVNSNRLVPKRYARVSYNKFRKNKNNFLKKSMTFTPRALKNRGVTFNFFFTYYFAYFFHYQTHILYKSLYKYMFAHALLRQEYTVVSQRSKYLRRRNMWAFDFIFFMQYSVTFANTLFLWPFFVFHLKRTFKRHGATMQLIVNVLRTIFFLKPYFKGFKLMIKGPFDRHGRSRKLLLHLGHMGFTTYMHHPIIYDMIHCPIVYGMCSIKFWMAYE